MVARFTLAMTDINPVPWKASNKGKHGGFYKDDNLRTYQNAVQSEAERVLSLSGLALPIFEPKTPLLVKFRFWCQQEISHTRTGRTRRSSRPDTTNLVKALEDALQDVVYKNDQANVQVSGELVQWGPDVQPGFTAVIAKDPFVRLPGDTLANAIGKFSNLTASPAGDVFFEVEDFR